jgi:hypothetical protein
VCQLAVAGDKKTAGPATVVAGAPPRPAAAARLLLLSRFAPARPATPAALVVRLTRLRWLSLLSLLLPSRRLERAFLGELIARRRDAAGDADLLAEHVAAVVRRVGAVTRPDQARLDRDAPARRDDIA